MGEDVISDDYVEKPGWNLLSPDRKRRGLVYNDWVEDFVIDVDEDDMLARMK